MKHQYWLAEDCPNCGERDSLDAWKGARMGSTRWEHGYSCCSEKCGMEYRDSPKRWRRELAAVDGQIASLKSRRREIEKRLDPQPGECP
jgi:hypothetical protein